MSEAPPPAESSVKKPRFRAPDTMTREQWDAMRNSLPERIDEVMASFKEDKLSVKPRAAVPHDDDDDGQSTLFLLSEGPEPVRKSRWIWLVAGVGLVGLLGLGWYVNNERASRAKPAYQPDPATSAVTGGKILDPTSAVNIAPQDDAKTTQAEITQPPVVAPAAASTTPAVRADKDDKQQEALKLSPPASKQEKQTVDVAPAVEPKAPAPSTKPKNNKNKPGSKPANKPAHTADEEVRTIEDLTPLLRGKDNKQP